MKKIFALLLAFLMLFPMSVFSAEQGNDIKIYVDGELLKLNAPPVLRDDRTLVPLRPIAEALGLEVSWKEKEKTVTLGKFEDGKLVTLCVLLIGSDKIETDGGNGLLGTPPVIINDVTMLPLRDIAELLDCQVDWDNKTRSVFILTPQSRSDKSVDSYPQLLPMKNGEDVAVMTTSMGVIKLRFFPDYAPKAVENFITHSKNGYYDGITFHRVINSFMIQSGDPTGTGMGGESIWGDPFDLEVDSNLRHFRGAVAMANTGQPNSNGSQFYIVQNNKLPDEVIANLQEDLTHPDEIIGEDENGKSITIKDLTPVLEEYAKNGGAYYLDFSYTVFAQVYEGMDVVDAIAAVKVDDADLQSPKPLTDVIIKNIKIEKYKK